MEPNRSRSACCRLAVAMVAMAGLLAAPAHAIQLKAGGVPVDFVRWSPEARAADGTRTLDAARRDELAGAGRDVAYAMRHYDVHVQRGGAVVSRTVKVHAILSRQGVDEHSDVGFLVNAHTTTVDILAAHTLTPDGRRVPVSPETIQVRTYNDANIFTNAFEVTVPFPAVAPGASLVLVTSARFDAGRSPVPWSKLFAPQTGTHVESFRLRVHWDDDRVVPRLASNLASVECAAPGGRERVCSGTGLEPLTATGASFGALDLLPHVMVSLAPDWGTMARLVREFTIDKANGGASVRARFSKLGASGSKRERLEALHRFVARDIRYLGLEQEEGAYIPRTATHTLERGYGDCKDKTVLFLDLAKMAGLDAWPVLVATLRSDPKALLAAAPGYFNHMIACVDVGEGLPACVDLTDNHAAAGTIGPGVAGTVILPLTLTASVPITLPAPDYSLEIGLTSEVTLANDGSISDRHNATYEGGVATAVRARVADLGEADRSNWASGMLAGISQTDEKATGIALTGLDLDAPRFGVQGRIRNATPFEDERLPGVHRRLDWPVAEAVRSLYVPERSREAVAINGIRIRSEFVINEATLDQSVLNAPLEFRSDFGSFSRQARREGSDTHVTTAFQVPRQTVSTADLEGYRNFLDRVFREGLVAFAVRRPGVFTGGGNGAGSTPDESGDQ